jgi:hypothetical protein
MVTCLEAQVNETWHIERKHSYRERGSNARPLRSGRDRRCDHYENNLRRYLKEAEEEGKKSKYKAI